MLQTVLFCTYFFDTHHCGNMIKKKLHLIIFPEFISLKERGYLQAPFVLFNPLDAKTYRT